MKLNFFTKEYEKTKNLDSILKNANNTLAVLTTVRCVSGFSDFHYKHKTLYAWPLPFEKDRNLLSHIKKLGIEPNNIFMVKAYRVTHDHYKQYNRLKTVDIRPLIYLRSCITIHQIMALPPSETIVAAVWEMSKPLAQAAPKNTRESDLISHFAPRRDAMYTFSLPGKTWNYKIPAYLGPIIFKELRGFSQKEMKHLDRNIVAGKLSGKGGIKYRLLVQSEDALSLSRVVINTTISIQKVLPKAPWHDLVKAAVYEHHKVPNNN